MTHLIGILCYMRQATLLCVIVLLAGTLGACDTAEVNPEPQPDTEPTCPGFIGANASLADTTLFTGEGQMRVRLGGDRLGFIHSLGLPFAHTVHSTNPEAADVHLQGSDTLEVVVTPGRSGTATITVAAQTACGATETAEINITAVNICDTALPDGYAVYFPAEVGQTWVYDYADTLSISPNPNSTAAGTHRWHISSAGSCVGGQRTFTIERHTEVNRTLYSGATSERTEHDALQAKLTGRKLWIEDHPTPSMQWIYPAGTPEQVQSDSTAMLLSSTTIYHATLQRNVGLASWRRHLFFRGADRYQLTLRPE